MYTLYGHGDSGSAAIECALRLAGAPYRFIRAATWDESSARAELRRVNPLGQIPVLVLEDGSALTESAAILIHLGLQHPAAGLLPASPVQRAHVIQGLVFIAANCYSAVGIVDYPERWLGDAAPEAKESLKAGTRNRLHASWEVFADLFRPEPWLSGPSPGALDLLAAVVSRWHGTRQHLQRTRPALARLLAEVEQDERIREVLDRVTDG